MCDPTLLMVASAAASGAAAYKQSAATKAYATHNAQVADLQALDAQRAGDEQAGQVRRQTEQAIGRARAGYAGRGVDLNVGTPGDTVDQLDFFGQVDQATARTNAGRQAWGLRERAADFRAHADAENPLMAAGTSVLGSAAAVSGRWYEYGYPGYRPEGMDRVPGRR